MCGITWWQGWFGGADVAFVDRADIKVFIGPPTVAARYVILHSCINELLRADIISMVG